MDSDLARYCFIYAVLPLLLCNLLLFKFAGATFWFINPFRIEVVNLRLQGKCAVRSLRLSLRKKKIIVEGLTIGAIDADDTVASEGSDEGKSQIRYKSPQYRLEKYLPLLLRICNGLRIEISDLSVEHVHKYSIKEIRAAIKYKTSTELLNVNVIVSSAHWAGESVCQDFSLKLSTKLAGQTLNKHDLFSEIKADLKIFDVLIPLDAVRALDRSPASSSSTCKNCRPSHSYVRPEEPEFNASIQEGLRDLYEKIDTLRLTMAPISRFNVVIDRLAIRGVSLAQIPELQELNEALTYNIYATNINFDAIRYESTMPGFKLLFKDDDTPIKLGLTISNFAICLDMKRKCNVPSSNLIKVLEIPNISLYGSTNLFTQYFGDEDDSSLKNAILSLKCNVLTPTFDINVNHLSFYKCFKKNIRVFANSLKDNSNDVSNASYQWRKHLLIAYFENFLPLIDIKFTLEDTRVVISDEDDILIHKLTALMLRYNTERSLSIVNGKGEQIYDGRIGAEVLGLRLQHLNKNLDYSRGIASLESLVLRSALDIVPNLLLSSTLELDAIEVDLSELPTMIALNNIFRKLDIQIHDVEQNYFKPFYEKFAERLQLAEQACCTIRAEAKSHEILPSSFVFKELPAIFDYIKVTMRDLKMYLGCRSVFMPPETFSNIDAQSPDDLVNGKLRKLFHKTDKVELAFFGTKTQWHNKEDGARIRMVKSAQLSDYRYYDGDDLDNFSSSAATEVEHLWNVNILVDNISLTVIAETPESVKELSKKKVIEISAFTMAIYPDIDQLDSQGGSKLMLKCDTKNVYSVTSLMLAFFVISGIHTLNQIFGQDIMLQNQESMAKTHLMALSQAKTKSFLSHVEWKELKKYLNIEVFIERFNQVLDLPNGLKTRLEAFSTFISLTNMSEVSIKGEYFRLCVESPTVKRYWVRLVSITHFKVLTDLTRLKEQTKEKAGNFDNLLPSVTLENESWIFNIPHQFEMYRLFDNISTVVKAFKQMIYSFKSCKNSNVIFPKVMSAPYLPKVKLKSGRLNFTIDDDPFEKQMSMIFQIGLQEQKIRLAKLQEFDKHIERELMFTGKPHLKQNNTISSHAKKCDICNKINAIKNKLIFKKKSPHSKSSFSNESSFTPVDDYGGEYREHGILERASKLYEKLEENFSTSWINRIEQFRYKERESFFKSFSYLWGNVDYSKLPPDVNYRVLPFSTSPFLSIITIEGIDIDIFQPSFGVEATANFVYNLGKKVPTDTQYSFIFPMYLDAKFEELRWHLRDYPLPFIYIPRLEPSQVKDKSAIHIHGDFVVGEDMIQSERELRTLFIPLIPSITVENTDCYYSLLIPRTITAVKVFADLNLDINSKQTTQVTWGGGYQPAIQQAMQCFDNFSKPPLDPSAKTGFWDKLRYLFHAKVLISWKNDGRFEVGLKGSRSPHKIGSDASGFIVGFSKNISLSVNEEGDPKKFVSCSAEKIYFSIPNYFAKPLLVWSRPSTETVFVPINDETTLQECASYYYLSDLGTGVKDASKLRTMRSHYIEKTGIKLAGGVTLNVGTVFERRIPGTKQRTFDSTPHYNVRLSNPIYVEDINKHDSFSGFRSDFIHLSFTLLSASTSAYNALQLSPAGLVTFLKWWRSFAGNFPVRSGPLFGLQSMSPKFGEHLFTISYHADVSPLFLSYIAHSVDTSRLSKKSQSDNPEFAGVKAKATKFVMDLHQRKEVLITYQEELNRTKQIMKLNFLAGEVWTKKFDIRTVEGSFKPMTSQHDKKDAFFEVYDNDMAWYDVSDFNEAYSVDLENCVPKVRIQPLLYTPHFVYRKHASYGDKYQVDPKDHQPIPPFENGISHDCSLGKAKLLQLGILEERVQLLKDLKAKSINGEDSNLHHGNQQELLAKLSLGIEKAQHLLEDFRYMHDHENGPAGSHNFYYELPNLMRESMAQVYENRYCINYMLLKWNEDTRDAMYKFLYFLGLADQFSALSANKSLQIIEDVVRQKTDYDQMRSRQEDDRVPHEKRTVEIDLSNLKDNELNQSLSKILEKHLTELNISVKNVLRSNHYVEFLSPQIQLITNEEPDACIMVTSPGVKLEVVSFEGDTTNDEYRRDTIMKRYGVHVVNANVFYFRREDYMDYLDLYFNVAAYGHVEGTSWPPWVALELCFDSDYIPAEANIVKNLSAAICYDKVSELSSLYGLVKDKLQDKLGGFFPRVAVSSDSKTYMYIHKLVKNLFFYVEPENAELRKQIDKLTIGFDLGDVSQMRDVIEGLHSSLRILTTVENGFLFKRHILDDADKVELHNVQSERVHHLLRLYIMMKVFTSNSKWTDSAHSSLLWDFNVGKVILHLLVEKTKPFLDIGIERLHFERLESAGVFNNNKLTASKLQVNDLRDGVTFQNIVGPISPKHLTKDEMTDPSPLVFIMWEMDEPIGGIKVAKKAHTRITGLSLNLEDETVMKIVRWFMPDEIKPMLESDDSDDSESFDLDNAIADAEENGDAEILLDKHADLNEMVQRSSEFVIIESLHLNTFKVCVSFRGKGALRLANVTEFVYNFPTLKLQNQTLRVMDLLILLKKVLIKDLVRHTGRFLGTKVRRHRPDDDSSIATTYNGDAAPAESLRRLPSSSNSINSGSALISRSIKRLPSFSSNSKDVSK